MIQFSIMESNKSSRVLKWSVIIGIVIVLNLFFNYALSLVYKSPEYEKYCPNEQIVAPPTTQDKCVAAGGQWTENVYPVQAPVGPATKPAPISVTEVKGYCNPTYTCQKNYDTDYKVYQRNVFIVLVILGILSMVGGIFLRGSSAVATALSLGGVLSLIIAAVRYWEAAQNLLRVVILGLALLALIWLGIKKFRDDGIRS